MAEEPFEIPLFPLNVVLFPGMALPLHIFEPRYRAMTAHCLDSGVPMGIVLALPGDEREHEVPAHVGTLARIVDYQRLPDGRYNLLSVGTERFELLNVRHEQPYLTGQVRLLRDDDADLNPRDLVAEAREALDDYLRLVLSLVGSEDRTISIPEDAADLSYLIAMCLAGEDDEKQHLLEMRTIAERLVTGISLLRAEMQSLVEQAEMPTPADQDRSTLN